MRRTAVINQIRGLLLERGITLRTGRRHLDGRCLPLWKTLTRSCREHHARCCWQLKLELDQLAIRLEEADALIQQTAQDNEACRRLDAIPGIGPITATALIAAIGNGAAFRKGREFAAWVGLVPAEAARHQQTREHLLANPVRARCPCCLAISREAVCWSKSVASKSHVAHPFQCCGSSVSQYTSAYCLGRACQR